MKLDAVRSIWPWLFLLSMSIFFEVWARLAYDASFLFNLFNIQSILTFATAPLLLGIGVTFVIIAGGIDLSIGFTMGFAAVVFATITASLGGQDPLVALSIGVIATMLLVMIPGMINGWLIAGLHIPPFIGTLGMYGVARGMGFIVADGVTVPVNNPILFQLGTAKVFGLIPVPVLIATIVVLIAHFVLSKTRFGQYTYAIGGNREAALRAGINVKRHTLLLYMIAAGFAGLAGLIYTGRFSAGAAQAGEPLLLDSIAAVFIGGASFFGGSGKIFGTVIGALVIAVIQFGLVFVDVEPFWQFLAVGIVIIVAVLVDQSRTRLSSGEK
jgi:ribose transport system permease protein